MRIALLAIVASAALTAAIQAAAPHTIVFTRVFPNDGQIGLFVAARDGSSERPLLATHDMDYDPVWSPDGQSIVFTSDREGSADLFRVKPDGSGLERLTDSPAYDDQAAFSPGLRWNEQYAQDALQTFVRFRCRLTLNITRSPFLTVRT